MDCVLQSMRLYNTAAMCYPTQQMWEYLCGFFNTTNIFPQMLLTEHISNGSVFRFSE